MKLFIVALILSSINILFAQTSIKNITEITNLNEGKYYYPKFSNDDSKIFFTTENYKGIYYYDLSNKQIKIVNEDIGAGYEYSLTPDDKTIYFRVDNYINGRKYTSIKSKDLSSLEEKTIVNDKRELSSPKVLDNGNIAFNLNDQLKSETADDDLKNILSKNDALVFIENSKIALYINGQKRILTPAGNGNYIWPSISPDKSKLLFTLAGKGTFISDLEGNIISKIGYADAPKWSTDSKWILYMVDKDNGDYVTSSDIFVYSVDSGTKLQLTNTSNEFEMYPEFNKTGNKIVCNTYDGKILLIELSNEL